MTGNCDLTNKDLYQILECPPDSTQEQLKQAYHRKILETHPDKTKNKSQDSKLFQEILSAWEILGHPDLRKEYDNKCRQADLEAQGALIYARLTPADLDETTEEEELSYQCRCGNYYLVQKSDLEERNCVIHVPCQDCTFVIAIET